MNARARGVAPFADGVWLGSDPVKIVGMPMTSTMTVLRLGDGNLLLYSPVEMSDERRAAIEAIGHVAHLYAPNLFHHRWIGDWAAAFPSARVHAPPGLAKKRRDLRIDRTHGESPEPAFAGLIDEIPIEGFRLRETVLLYRPAQTLVVADLVHNVGRPTHGWSSVYTRLMGFYDQVALSRAIRWTGFSDKRATRRSIDTVIAHHFDRLVVGHGDPLASGGREAFGAAFRWLKG
jgi:hypothetical protein